MKSEKSKIILLKKIELRKPSIRSKKHGYVECLVKYIEKGSIKRDLFYIKIRKNWSKEDYLVKARRLLEQKLMKHSYEIRRPKKLVASLIAIAFLFAGVTVTFGTLWGLGYLKWNDHSRPEPTNNHTVTFVVNGGLPLVESQTDIVDGGYVIEPTGEKAPKKPGYTLQGWCTDEALTNKFEFTTRIYQDYILYADWGDIKKYTVNFLDSVTKQPIVESQTVDYNDKVQRPVAPIREGYTFDNWYKENLTDEYSFDTRLTDMSVNTINIYGIYTKNTYRVNYNANGGIITNPSTGYSEVSYEGTIDVPPTVVDESGTSLNPTWYWTPNFQSGTQFIFGIGDDATKVTSTMTLYAKYSEIHADSFTNDPWEIFLNEINGKSYNEIATSSAYSDDYITQGNTFVGLVRVISLEDESGVPHPYGVRVVDENTNALASDSKFTFMFSEFNETSIFAQKDNFYPDSMIKVYLNSVLASFPTIIKQHVSTETIDCYNTDVDVQSTVEEDAKIYIPSASQIFGNAGSYPIENEQFAYFKNGGALTNLDGAWLRTPSKFTQQFSLYVENGAVVDGGDQITSSHKVKPVFVIK